MSQVFKIFCVSFHFIQLREHLVPTWVKNGSIWASMHGRVLVCVIVFEHVWVCECMRVCASSCARVYECVGVCVSKCKCVEEWVNVSACAHSSKMMQWAFWTVAFWWRSNLYIFLPAVNSTNQTTAVGSIIKSFKVQNYKPITTFNHVDQKFDSPGLKVFLGGY